MKSLEHELEGSEKERRTLAERLKTVEGEKKEVVGGLQSKEVELTSQLEEMRAKVGYKQHYIVFDKAKN